MFLAGMSSLSLPFDFKAAQKLLNTDFSLLSEPPIHVFRSNSSSTPSPLSNPDRPLPLTAFFLSLGFSDTLWTLFTPWSKLPSYKALPTSCSTKELRKATEAPQQPQGPRSMSHFFNSPLT